MSGVIILANDSFTRSSATVKIKKATNIERMYSIRSCPKGCSSSAGFAESLKEIKEMMLLKLSERLLVPSATSDTAPNSEPTMILPSASRILTATPSRLASLPRRSRFFTDSVIKGSFVKIQCCLLLYSKCQKM